jgi:hypothetical protein
MEMMNSEKEIHEAFKLMGLLSKRDREMFQKMLTTEEDVGKQYLFILTSGHSKAEATEVEYARLE